MDHPNPAHESVPAPVMSPLRNVSAGLSRCRRSRLMNWRSLSLFSAVNSPAATRPAHAVSSALSTVASVVSPACARNSWKESYKRSKSCSCRWRSAPVTSPILLSVESRRARARGPVRLRPRCVRMPPRRGFLMHVATALLRDQFTLSREGAALAGGARARSPVPRDAGDRKFHIHTEMFSRLGLERPSTSFSIR